MCAETIGTRRLCAENLDPRVVVMVNDYGRDNLSFDPHRRVHRHCGLGVPAQAQSALCEGRPDPSRRWEGLSPAFAGPTRSSIRTTSTAIRRTGSAPALNDLAQPL